jgi:hypothetical protein
MDKAEKASLKARELTQQVLAFARGSDPVKNPFPLEDIIRLCPHHTEGISPVQFEVSTGRNSRWPMWIGNRSVMP